MEEAGFLHGVPEDGATATMHSALGGLVAR